MKNKILKERKSQNSKHITHSSGITLVALIITIIILLILAVVAIRAITEDGILEHAKTAKSSYIDAQIKEQVELAKQEYRLEHLGEFDAKDFVENIKTYIPEAEKIGETTIQIKETVVKIEGNGTIATTANAPELKTGMVPVKYDETQSAWVVTTKEDPEWYNYSEEAITKDGKTIEGKKWANVMLQDGLAYDETTGKVTQEGSMYVWIPRYAYKISKLTESAYEPSTITVTNSDTTTSTYSTRITNKAGIIEVVYLKGTTDDYEGGTATRGNVAESNYVVHPSFTNDVNIGGWDKELSGYWVAKFEAGYVGTAGNPSSAKDSAVSYSATWGYNGATSTSENIVNNYYGANQIKNGATYQKIKYPTFTGNKSSFNYISVGDSYSLCLSLNAAGNPYGIDSSSETHLMKNSEWGAVAYLSHSKYGRAGAEISINNSTAVSDAGVNGTRTVWGVTGGNNYKGNTNQSTTGNIYGIYDISGGIWERTASYINNNNGSINAYGASMKTGSSTKYITLYDKGTSDNRVPNYVAAKKFYGDAVTETSLFDETKTAGTNADYYYNYYTGWFHDYSVFPVYWRSVLQAWRRLLGWQPCR